MASTNDDPSASPNGGYDDGYRSCPRFWPPKPASALKFLSERQNLNGYNVLDLGCGEGTNATWLEARSCSVTAVEISAEAIAHARRLWPNSSVTWLNQDVTGFEAGAASYDLVIAYGLLHCLSTSDVSKVILAMQAATKPGGYNVVATFNDRDQDLGGHPGFQPTLLPHDDFIERYRNWDLLLATDETLYEQHPNNNIPHHHSMTRIVARKPNG